MEAIIIKETGADTIIELLKEHGYRINHYSKIEDVEPELENILNSKKITLIIIGSTFLFHVFNKNLPRIKKYHGKSAGLRFAKRNLQILQPWIKQKSVILLGFQKKHQIWAEEMNLNFVNLKCEYSLMFQIKQQKNKNTLGESHGKDN